MSNQKAEQICFVMQHVTKGTHMDYVYEMARTLRQEEGLPLTLFVEKGTPNNEDWIKTQRFSFAPLRIVENFIQILRFRIQGHTIFYIHYSLISTISAGIVTKLFGGTVYYWNCGMPWLFKRNVFERTYERTAFKLIDYLVTGAESLIPKYMDTYDLHRDQIRVIPNWIDLENLSHDPQAYTRVREQFSIPQDGRILLFTHKLVKRKGAHYLPEILNGIKDEKVHLIIAGDGEERKTIESKFEEYGLAHRVHVLGYVGREKVQELLQAADIFVMPSEEEGCPHSLIEAMAYELPFVAFDVGGVKEISPVFAQNFLYPVGCVEDMSERINQLLVDKQAREQFKSGEKEHVGKFAKTKIVQHFHSILISR